MSVAKRFFDTNILLYLLSADAAKADRVEEVVAAGGTLSVQVLNEFTAVALRKLGMKVSQVREALEPIIEVCQVIPLTTQIHQRALQITERYRFAFYDASIVAAALESGSTTLYSEDLQHGQIIDRTLTVKNPFVG